MKASKRAGKKRKWVYMKTFFTMIIVIFLSFSAIIMEDKTQCSEKEFSSVIKNGVSSNGEVACNNKATKPVDTVEIAQDCVITTPPTTTVKDFNNEVYTTTVVMPDSNDIVISEPVYIVESSEIITTDYLEKENVETTSSNTVSCVYETTVTTVENKEITAIHSVNETVATTVKTNNNEISDISSETDYICESTEASVTTTEKSEIVNEFDIILISLNGFVPNTTYTITQNIDGKAEVIELTSDSKGIIECEILSDSTYAEFSYVVEEFYYAVSYYISEGHITSALSSVRMIEHK